MGGAAVPTWSVVIANLVELRSAGPSTSLRAGLGIPLWGTPHKGCAPFARRRESARPGPSLAKGTRSLRMTSCLVKYVGGRRRSGRMLGQRRIQKLGRADGRCLSSFSPFSPNLFSLNLFSFNLCCVFFGCGFLASSLVSGGQAMRHQASRYFSSRALRPLWG